MFSDREQRLLPWPDISLLWLHSLSIQPRRNIYNSQCYLPEEQNHSCCMKYHICRYNSWIHIQMELILYTTECYFDVFTGVVRVRIITVYVEIIACDFLWLRR